MDDQKLRTMLGALVKTPLNLSAPLYHAANCWTKRVTLAKALLGSMRN